MGRQLNLVLRFLREALSRPGMLLKQYIPEKKVYQQLAYKLNIITPFCCFELRVTAFHGSNLDIGVISTLLKHLRKILLMRKLQNQPK